MRSWRDEDETHPLDVALGAQIRQFRKLRNMSQERLADATGVTFQQIQKYERGSNRVSFSRLTMIAQALGVRIADLIAPLDEPEPEVAVRQISDRMRFPGAADLIEAFTAIRDDGVRRKVVDLVAEMARAHEMDRFP